MHLGYIVLAISARTTVEHQTYVHHRNWTREEREFHNTRAHTMHHRSEAQKFLFDAYMLEKEVKASRHRREAAYAKEKRSKELDKNVEGSRLEAIELRLAKLVSVLSSTVHERLMLCFFWFQRQPELLPCVSYLCRSLPLRACPRARDIETRVRCFRVPRVVTRQTKEGYCAYPRAPDRNCTWGWGRACDPYEHVQC